MASAANATCSSPSTAARAPCTSRSRTTRPRPAQGLFGGGARRLPVPGHARADRPRLLLHRRGLREALPLGIEHRKTKPYTPRTNGMVERFNGRVQREVLGITVAGHRDLERLLAGFNSAYNARRQRVLGGSSPEAIVQERLGQDRGLANPGYRPPSDPCVLPRAMLVIERAKDLSQPDN